MNDKPEQAEAQHPPAPKRRRHGIWFFVGLGVLAILSGMVVLGLTGRNLPAPEWMVTRIEARANAALAGQASVAIGGIDVLVDDTYVPHVRLRDVALFSASGRRVATLPDVRTTLHGKPVLSGRVEPQSLRISGARIALRRLSDGSLDIELGETATETGGGVTGVVELLKLIDDVFDLPVLSGIETIEVYALDLRLSDARSGQLWTASDAWLTMQQDQKRVIVDLGFGLAEAGRKPAHAVLNFLTTKNSPEARMTARVSGVSARDLAAQSTALAWLGALDAPISGSIRTGVDPLGRIEKLTASLELGAGALQPSPTTRPVVFDGARLGLSYDPDAALLTLSEITLESPALRVKANGKAWLKDLAADGTGALVGQIAIADFSADPEGLFADPVSFSQGALDLRLELAPFRLQLGQLVLVDGDRRISASGTVGAAPDGWEVALDAKMDAIASARLLALWPVSVVPLTRLWLEENVATSELFDVTAALRLRPGEDAHFALGYEYRSTDVRILRTLPPVQNGAGYAAINDYSYTLVVDRGHVTAPAGGKVDVSGTVLSIPDLRIKPAPAEIRLRTESDITAALSLLDQPPFQFLTKAGRAVDIAEGRARIDAQLKLVLAKVIDPKDVSYQVTAKLLDVRTDNAVPGRLLAANELDLVASREGIEISGPATVSGIPVEATWRQSFDPARKNHSNVEGTVELSPQFLTVFGIGLPEGSVKGRGIARISLEIEKGKETRAVLQSDLEGVDLSIPEIGWRKGKNSPGRLLVRARLGSPVAIDRLELEGAGLAVSGKVLIAPDGQMERILLGSVSVGGWFNGPVELVGRGKGRSVAVVVGGGTADMRRATLAGGRGGDGPMSVALDQLRISEGIALRGFRGNFSSVGGFAGEFTATVNGTAPVKGTVAPFAGRSGFRIRADDAGAVLRAAGIFERGIGGTLDMTLRPLQASGQYEGALAIRQIHVADAPVLADLLDAISVVGLLSQLSGPGILFNNVTGDFRLTPAGVEISRGAAIGASLGISAAGIYDTNARRVDLRGTISPVYLLNGIGQIFAKKGEGLFGFNYRLSGPSDAPKVSVNPLSILTPGMFRELFRSEPPTMAP